MKKVLLVLLFASMASVYNCASWGKDTATSSPRLSVDTHKVLARPTEYTVEIDTNTWVEGKSYEGTELFGISFFENRFVSPTLLNKEGYDAYTLDAIRDAVKKSNADAFHVVKTKATVFAFPFNRLPLYVTYQVEVKGHPMKYKFLGPVSEAKADEIYANGLSSSGYAMDPSTPLYPAKSVGVKPVGCCK
jgi:hypothetical protein